MDTTTITDRNHFDFIYFMADYMHKKTHYITQEIINKFNTILNVYGLPFKILIDNFITLSKE